MDFLTANNTYFLALCTPLLIFLFCILIFLHIQKVTHKAYESIKEKEPSLFQYLIKILYTIQPICYFSLALFLSSLFITIPHAIEKYLHAYFIIILIFQIGLLLEPVIHFLFFETLHRNGSKRVIYLLVMLGKIILILFTIIYILTFFGINVNTLITGLGIGGIAVALALQNILNDLFSSFSIYIDKPFEVGDFIIVGGDLGTVKKIGIKSTRIASLNGEEIVISNKDITAERIHNYKHLKQRRIQYTFNIPYSTPAPLLEQIPGLITEIFEGIDQVALDRIHLAHFGEYAWTYEMVYFVQSSDYLLYMNKNQELLVKIKYIFDEHGIHIAVPARDITPHAT